MTSQLRPRHDDDHQAHSQLAHDKYVEHLEAMIAEGTTALGWQKAWPNQITNAEPELVTVLEQLRVFLRRATVNHDEVTGDGYEREPVARKTFTLDAGGDLVDSDVTHE